MDAKILLVAIIIIVAAALLVYIRYANLGTANSTISTTSTINTTSSTAVSTMSTSQSTSTIYNIAKNGTLNVQQVISDLGTGWTAASQHNYGSSSVYLANGTTANVNGYGVANFSNGGSFLITEWIQFKGDSAASNYANYSFETEFPGAANVTRGNLQNATYVFYSGLSINNGQAASAVYAYVGNYSILIFNQGTSFQLQQAKELLSSQISDLNG